MRPGEALFRDIVVADGQTLQRASELQREQQRGKERQGMVPQGGSYEVFFDTALGMWPMSKIIQEHKVIPNSSVTGPQQQCSEGLLAQSLNKAFARAVPLQPKPSTRIDHPQQPRQDKLKLNLSSGPSQRDSEMIEETPQGQIVHG